MNPGLRVTQKIRKILEELNISDVVELPKVGQTRPCPYTQVYEALDIIHKKVQIMRQEEIRASIQTLPYDTNS